MRCNSLLAKLYYSSHANDPNAGGKHEPRIAATGDSARTRDPIFLRATRALQLPCTLLAFSLPVLAITACGETRDNPRNVASASALPAAATPRQGSELTEGAATPNVPFTLQDGFELFLPQMKGKVITVVFCSATTDPECLQELRGLRDHWRVMHDNYNVVVVAVSPQTTSANKTLIASQSLPFDVASDLEGHIAGAFGVPTLPTSSPRVFLIGRDGTVRSAWRSANPDLHVREILSAARG
jgi:peroxiredoxin